MTSPPDPARIQSAADAVLRTLIRCGIGGDQAMCMSVLGAVAGSIAVASEFPDVAMQTFNRLARGVIDGARE